MKIKEMPSTPSLEIGVGGNSRLMILGKHLEMIL